MPRAKKVKEAVEPSTRFTVGTTTNGYGVHYWFVFDTEEQERIDGRMADLEAAENVATLMNSGGTRKSHSKL